MSPAREPVLAALAKAFSLNNVMLSVDQTR